MIFAVHDDAGEIIGFYRDDLHKDIPAPNVEISEEAWREHISGAKSYRVEGGRLIEYVAPAPTLEERKEAAIAKAHSIASDIRRQIAEYASVERGLSWINKVPYAAFWKLHEDGGDPAGPFADLAAEAEEGFQIEADVRGTTAIALRDRTLAKNETFFRATQLVEGMEGLAETTIPAADDDDELDAAIAQLQTLQAQAMVQLDVIINGAS